MLLVEKSVVATVAWVSSVCLCGVGGRSRVRSRKQAGMQAGKSPIHASKRERAREWIKGILWLGIVAQSRVCVRRGCAIPMGGRLLA